MDSLHYSLFANNMTSNSSGNNNNLVLPLEERNILIAGSSGCGKSSLVFTLARGVFPGNFTPHRFEGWSITAAATPKDSLVTLGDPGGQFSKAALKAASKPYLVSLTFWEDRPRKHLWEKKLAQRRQLEREIKAKEDEDEAAAKDAELLADLENPTSKQRRSSRVSYETVNGVTRAKYGTSPDFVSVPGSASPKTIVKGKPPLPPSKYDNDNSSSATKNDEEDGCGDNDFPEMKLCIPRPWLCPDPDIIVLCYSVVDLNSMKEATEVIWPELITKFPNVPLILVATKCDLRDKDTKKEDDETPLWNIDDGNEARAEREEVERPEKEEKGNFATSVMGNSLAHELGANAYIECSAAEKRGLRHIVEEAVWILNSAMIANAEAAAIDAADGGSTASPKSRKWSLSSSYSNSSSKMRKTSDNVSMVSAARKISTSSIGSYSSPRPTISVQSPFSTSLPAQVTPSVARSRKQSYGATVKRIWQNVSPK